MANVTIPIHTSVESYRYTPGVYHIVVGNHLMFVDSSSKNHAVHLVIMQMVLSLIVLLQENSVSLQPNNYYFCIIQYSIEFFFFVEFSK
jgi:hypothetical protein